MRSDYVHGIDLSRLGGCTHGPNSETTEGAAVSGRVDAGREAVDALGAARVKSVPAGIADGGATAVSERRVPARAPAPMLVPRRCDVSARSPAATAGLPGSTPNSRPPDESAPADRAFARTPAECGAATALERTLPCSGAMAAGRTPATAAP